MSALFGPLLPTKPSTGVQAAALSSVYFVASHTKELASFCFRCLTVYDNKVPVDEIYPFRSPTSIRHHVAHKADRLLSRVWMQETSNYILPFFSQYIKDLFTCHTDYFQIKVV